jgi:hypothetical protein
MTIFRKHSSTEQIGRTRFEITSLLDLFKPHPKILVRKSEYKN